MASQARRTMQFLSQFSITGYTSRLFHSSIAVLPFSTLELPANSSNNDQLRNSMETKPKIDESYVLSQSSDLLPICRKDLTTVAMPKVVMDHDEVINKAVVDECLLPEERLRGIFLQKLKGKSAIYRALADVGVKMSIEVVGEVVNRGNLGGEAMVMFFNWAIEQPGVVRDVDGYHVILKALGRRRFFTYMVDLLGDMKMRGIKPNCETLFVVMDSFVRARQLFRAMQMFKQLEDFGWKCYTEALNVVVVSEQGKIIKEHLN